ncbi:MAG: polysaccharide deacetylase family protein [Candidatus Omnitrophota bacterium]
MHTKIALLLPGHQYYFQSDITPNGKIDAFRKKIYERINRSGFLCEYIGRKDINNAALSGYTALFLLNIEKLSDDQHETIKTYIKNGGDLVLSYRSPLLEGFGIKINGVHHSHAISLGQKEIIYSAVNIDNILFKINRKYLNNALPLQQILKLPALKIDADKNNTALAAWKGSGLSALMINSSYASPGKIIYFPGVLAGTEPSLLEHILSLLEKNNTKRLPFIPKDKRCCVTLFYDYEREYGNRRLGLHAKRGLEFILESQKKYHIKATFNTVGKICEAYPETIERIIKDGHEISSHMYNSEVPSKTKREVIENSIKLSLKKFKDMFNIDIKGIRSPESKWSRDLIEILQDNGLLWDAEDEASSFPYNMVLERRLDIVRMPVSCDDFPYISQRSSPEAMLQKFISTVEKGIKEKNFVSIGFHPWIQGMEEKRLKAFEKFLDYLSSNDNIVLMTFGEVYNWLKTRNSIS